MVESLFSLDAKVLKQLLLCLLERFHFSTELVDLLALKLMGFALKAIDCLKKSIRVFYFILDERPELFEEGGEVLGLLLSFLQLLVEEFLGVSQQGD